MEDRATGRLNALLNYTIHFPLATTFQSLPPTNLTLGQFQLITKTFTARGSWSLEAEMKLHQNDP